VHLSQSGYSLFGTVRTQAGPMAYGAPDGESSTGTACRPLLSGLDRRSVLCPPGTRPHRIWPELTKRTASTHKELRRRINRITENR
jgi:hypothetical protein